MIFNASQTVQDLLQNIHKGTRAAINLHTHDKDKMAVIAAQLEEYFQPDAITLDVSAYTSFDDLTRDLIMQLLLRDDKPENCRVADAAIETQSPKLLRRNVGRLLNSLSDQKAWTCLILKNFDPAEEYWDDKACAWVRELVDTGKIPACVILSAEPLSQIADRPEGSSPLYNIFKMHLLEEEN